MQTVCQLDQDDADILRHGEKHFAQISRLHLLLYLGPVPVISGELQFFQLGHAVDQTRDISAELLFDLLACQDCVLHHIMQKSGGNGFLIQFEVRQNRGDIQRVNDIWLPGFTQLPFMSIAGHLISFFDQ